MPEWAPRVIGPGAHCLGALDRLGLSPGGEVLVIGLAGGLDSRALPGMVFQVAAVWDSNGEISKPTADVAGFGIPGKIPPAVIACVNSVVSTPKAKADLAQRTGAGLVDMESAHLAAWCDRNGRKWCMVRVVLDGPEDALPPGIGGWTRGDGELDPWSMLGSLFRHPGAILSLPRLARARRMAGRNLRMALGPPTAFRTREG